jgi:hypothetical protein
MLLSGVIFLSAISTTCLSRRLTPEERERMKKAAENRRRFSRSGFLLRRWVRRNLLGSPAGEAQDGS